jgi:hypothetical protein
MKRFEVWLKGLLAAAISGAAGGVQGLQLLASIHSILIYRPRH